MYIIFLPNFTLKLSNINGDSQEICFKLNNILFNHEMVYIFTVIIGSWLNKWLIHYNTSPVHYKICNSSVVAHDVR